MGFLNKIDQRTAVARLLRERFETICNDLGGGKELSHLQRSLVDRAVFLEAVLQTLENEMAARGLDKGETLARHIQVTNAYTSLCSKLGIERKTLSLPWAVPAVNVPPANGTDK